MRKLYSKILSSVLIFILFFGWFQVPIAGGATLSTGSLLLSDSRPSNASTTYTFTFSNVTTSAIKCMKIVFATTSTGTTAPTGFNSSSSAAYDAASTYAGGTWTLDKTTNGTLLLTLTAGTVPAGASARTIVITGITNSSVVDTAYFGQVSTFNNTDCASSPVDSGTVAFINTSGQTVTATVDPSLTFTVNSVSSGTVNVATVNITTTATTIPFGTVTSSTNKIGAHDLTIGTNASGGYTVTTKYTGALTNLAAKTIDDFTATNDTPATFFVAGTEAFGYTTRDSSLGTGTPDRFTSSGGNKWSKFTTSPLEVAYSDAAVSETVRVGYQVGVAATTEAGTYTTTVVYTATPIY